MTSIRIGAPQTASPGEIIELRTLIQHPMETGFRRDRRGAVIPRHILTEFVCLFDGEEIFRAELFPGVSANPFIGFTMIAETSGTLEFRWTDQNGEVFSEARPLTVA